MPPSFDPNPFSFYPRPSGRGSIAAPTTTTAPDSGAHLPPAIRPGLHCGLRTLWSMSARVSTSPGHQAGAPLRRRPISSRFRTVARSSPGHQAGAPLRRSAQRGRRGSSWLLPPAIRPGLHCGNAESDGMLGHEGRLPPAIRPGLHCGVPAVVVVSSGWPASPGHQAGAPLRRREGRGPGVKRAGLPPAIRPGLHCGGASHGGYPGALVASPGHQAGAPLRLAHVVEHVGEGVDFPRPSGRGSIAASTHIFQVSNGGAVFPRPSGRDSIAAGYRLGSTPPAVPSPGHQAGAPLRRRRRGVHQPCRGASLPTAIKPGLHCG